MEPRFASITEVANKSFDYIIAGGGTTGLCLAARLTEDPQVTVLVLEAGESHLNDPHVDMPSGFLQQIGRPKYDWDFKTTPQKYLGNSTLTWTRGKGLGGSSNINYMAWTRPSREDIDAWERLGNPGWNFDKFLPYIKRCENYHHPSQEIIDREEIGADAAWYGHGGPISVSFSNLSPEWGRMVREALKVRGIQTVKDNVNGQTTGTWCNPSSVDPRGFTRSSSVTGYFLPNSGRKNLHVLTEASVARIVLEDVQNVELVSARGVEFSHGGKIFQTYAKLEVILCAGALKSPQILELSGIGDPAILEPLGIDVKVNLPGVGTNIQDHVGHLGLSYELREDANMLTMDVLSDVAEREKHMELYAQKQPSLFSFTGNAVTFLPIQTLSERAGAIIQSQSDKIMKGRDSYPAGQLDQFDVQVNHLKDPSTHEVEIIANPVFQGFINKSEKGKQYVSFVVALTSPWSRGSIHIVSKDPSAQPMMDPCYLKENIDSELLVEAFKFARSLSEVDSLKKVLAKEANPGPSVTSEDEIRDHIKQNMRTLWHVAGSLSMLPREKQGVVDTQLRVWGTQNIRVADISIMPLLVGVHTQTVAYGIAERAADIIRGRAEA